MQKTWVIWTSKRHFLLAIKSYFLKHASSDYCPGLYWVRCCKKVKGKGQFFSNGIIVLILQRRANSPGIKCLTGHCMQTQWNIDTAWLCSGESKENQFPLPLSSRWQKLCFSHTETRHSHEYELDLRKICCSKVWGAGAALRCKIDTHILVHSLIPRSICHLQFWAKERDKNGSKKS